MIPGNLRSRPLKSSPRQAASGPAGGAPGAGGRAHRWNCCATSPAPAWTFRTSQVPRATSYLRSPESAGADGKGILWVQLFPIYNPEARRCGSELVVRWLSAQPWHGPGPRGLGAETLFSSRGGPPTSWSGRHGTRLQKASSSSVLGPSPHSYPPPPALGHAPWTTARSLPLATWRGHPKSC